MSDFYKYKVGDIIYLKDTEKHTLGRADVYTGIILSVNMHKDWWGGGYYDFIWTPEIYDPSGFHRLSFQQIVDWNSRKEAEVYPIE